MPGGIGARGPLKPQNFFVSPEPFTVSSTEVDTVGGALTLTSFAPTISTPVLITPAKASLVLTGSTSTVATPRLVIPAKASLLLSEFAPSVITPVKVTPAAKALTLTTFSPSVTATAKVQVTPGTGQLVLTEFGPVITGQVIQPDQGGSAGGGKVPYRRIRIYEPAPRTRPPAMPEPQVAKVPLVIQPVTSDDEEVLVALYVAGAIDLEEFAALIAA